VSEPSRPTKVTIGNVTVEAHPSGIMRASCRVCSDKSGNLDEYSLGPWARSHDHR
jgi:hypothetical protein